jgi:hypothetical protein
MPKQVMTSSAVLIALCHYLYARGIRPAPQDPMKKNRPAIPKAAPKPGDARAPKAPIWAPRQSKAPQTHVKPRDTSQKSGQRGR